MALKEMKVAELRQVAEDFGVDTEGVKSKASLIAALAEEGVTDEVYEQVTNALKGDAPSDVDPVDAPAPKSVPVATKAPLGQEDTVLVLMTRANPHYETYGYTFTKEHPFAAMKVSEAEDLMASERGFHLATEREVREYYN